MHEVDFSEISSDEKFKRELTRISNRNAQHGSDATMSHVIFAPVFLPKSRWLTLRPVFDTLPDLSLMITAMGSERLQCVPKQENENFYQSWADIKSKTFAQIVFS